MRGLDPRIHPLKKRVARWIAGSRLRQKASPGTDCCGRRSFSEAGKPAMTTLEMARIVQT
jgi:hypothetical protein